MSRPRTQTPAERVLEMRGYSYQEVALKMNASEVHVRKVCQGSAIPSGPFRLLMAHVLDVSEAALFPDMAERRRRQTSSTSTREAADAG